MRLIFTSAIFIGYVSGGCRTKAAHSVSTTQSIPATQSVASDQAAAERINLSIRRGVEFLIADQQPDGAWGTGLETHGNEVTSMVPGSHDAYRVATTALCVMALREVGEKSAHDRGLHYLVEHGQARRDDGTLMYNIWAHIYMVQAMAMELENHPGDAGIIAAAKWNLDRMVRYQTVLGGWNYYDFRAQTQTPSMGPTSFGTAAGLVALIDAKNAGLTVPPGMIERCVRRLEEMRLPNGAYLYGSDYRYVPMLPAHHMQGSVGRAQAANNALWLAGSTKIGEPQVREALDWLIRDHIFLDMGRKRPYPHESWFQTSGYYYYFDHYYAARSIDCLTPPGRAYYARKLVEMIIPHQEEDGSWWDYPMWDYHKPYGTAFAVMTLLRCQRSEGNPPWRMSQAAPSDARDPIIR